MYNLWCDHDIMLFEKKNGHRKKNVLTLAISPKKTIIFQKSSIFPSFTYLWIRHDYTYLLSPKTYLRYEDHGRRALSHHPFHFLWRPLWVRPCVHPATGGAVSLLFPRPNHLWFWTLGWSESSVSPPPTPWPAPQASSPNDNSPATKGNTVSYPLEMTAASTGLTLFSVFLY